MRNARLGALAAMAASLAMPVAAMAQQQTTMVPYGGDKPAPVGQTAVDPGDSAEEIAKDAARDLKDTRFYNKPGATRAQYDADWQQCRLIARGSRTPSGMVPYSYNPALVSPVAAGIAGGLGGMLGAAIAQGQQRRDNRRACLLIRGWRQVEVPPAEAARVAAMGEAQRAAYIDALVGANDVKGTITARTRFDDAPDARINLDAPVGRTGTVFAGKKVDAAQPFVLGPDEALLVLAFRRAEAPAEGRSGAVQLLRYDAEHGDVVYRPRDWKKTGDKTVYAVLAQSADKKQAYEVQLIRVTPGAYVLDGTSVGAAVPVSTNCFGAPVLDVKAGEVAYLGDFAPYMNAPTSDGDKRSALLFSRHIEDARAALATRQPQLAAAMQPARLRNRATYACAGLTMTRWDIAGLEAVAR
ncbi:MULTISPECIES: hypothetical protein [unclassified Sphingomonas]|jgi:hypothetical protein|nr:MULTISPECIES: hypothetical protein [unclassified Sphingomonas]